MWWTRSSGDAGVGMRLVGLSAGWVGTGGWGTDGRRCVEVSGFGNRCSQVISTF